MGWNVFWGRVTEDPILLVTILLVIGVVIVNGWTDAPNAIATCISTRSIKPGKAVALAAVFNFFGVLSMGMVHAKVSSTIYHMVKLETNKNMGILVLCAAMVAIVIWATAAWWFGIPTSESHALIAGLSGAAVAIHNSFEGIAADEWKKVFYGLVFSSLFGFGAGWLAARIIKHCCKNGERGRLNFFFEKAQIAGGAAMAFMHGAQDGQKFIGILMLVISMMTDTAVESPKVWMMLGISVMMTLGTAMGGRRIIKAVGRDMVRLKKYQGIAADAAAAVCLGISTMTGFPVSTTHTKTTAVMGVGAEERLANVKWGVVREMVTAWLLTFPGCGALAYMMVKLFLFVFGKTRGM